jgi:hypothetical protein
MAKVVVSNVRRGVAAEGRNEHVMFDSRIIALGLTSSDASSYLLAWTQYRMEPGF